MKSKSQSRVAVITGASSGIGEATARALSAKGYRVALLARRVDRIETLGDQLGDGALAIQADVTDRDSLVAAAARVQSELGGADVLVNNAGIMLLGPFISDPDPQLVPILSALPLVDVALGGRCAWAASSGRGPAGRPAGGPF